MTTKQTSLAVQEQAIEPLSLIQQALDKGFTGDQLNGLLEFARNLKAEQAKEAYFTAFNEFKENPPRIEKTAKAKVQTKNGGVFEIPYAPLDEVCDKLIPALSGLGITHRWTSDASEAGVTVTCYLRHKMGYEEKGASLLAPADQSGAKNAVQAVGSTVSYLQRYTLLASCGIAVEGADTNGVVQDEKLIELIAQMDMAESLADAKEAYGKAFTWARERNDNGRSMAAVVKKFEDLKRDFAKARTA